MAKRAADPLSFRHLDVEADQHRRKHARRRRPSFDLARAKLAEMNRSLAVADQHERTALVVLSQIVPPGGNHVRVGKGKTLR